MKRPITIAIFALGGQGGGVLANWLINLAEQNDYFTQSTSVPGVAQRTGATVYYLEIFPKDGYNNISPVMALMPMVGDVELVVASELMEAARAIQKQFVTRDKTTLITSSHRVYAISEKMVLGDGRGDSETVLKVAEQASKRFIAFDMENLAAQTECVMSSIMFGAIAGSGHLPFAREKFEDAIRAEGKMVEANLRGFEAGYKTAKKPLDHKEEIKPHIGQITGQANTPEATALISRINTLPEQAREFSYAGARKLLDYQDIDYAAQYLTILEGFSAQDRGNCDLTRELARYLALWMSFDDVIKVADIKTRSERVEKYREEVRAADDQIIHMIEYMHPRIDEIIGTMPLGMAHLVQKSSLLMWFFKKFTGQRLLDTTKISSFLMLYFLASLKSIRRKTLRYAQEHEQINIWLDLAAHTLKTDYNLAVEIIRCQRLIKGYGETHARGMGNFNMIMARIDQGKLTAADVVEMRTAALADEDGTALKKEMQKKVK